MFSNNYRSLSQPPQLKAKTRLIAGVAVLLLSPYSFAQSESEDSNSNKTAFNMPVAQQANSLTLATAISRTLSENPTLKVFKLRQASLNGQQQTQALSPGYELGFDIENFAGTGELNGFDSAEFTVSLSSIIELGDKQEARINVSHSRTSQLAAQQKIAALSLLGEVTRRYIDVLAAQARSALAIEAVQLAQETLDEVEKRAKSGSTPKAEVKRAMAAVGNAKLTSSAEKQQFDYTKRTLAMLWNERTPRFSQLEGNLYAFSDDITFEQLFTKVQQNPEILALASKERLKAAEVRLAQSQSSNNIKWSVGVRQMQDVGDTALVAGFSIPLFTSTNNNGAIISAQAERDEVLADKQVTLLKLHTQLQQAYANRKQAIYTANSLKNTIIPLLKEALQETQIAYQRGLYSYLDYLSARHELLIAQRALIDSAAAALRFGADIEQLIAEPLPASQHASLANYRFTQG